MEEETGTRVECLAQDLAASKWQTRPLKSRVIPLSTRTQLELVRAFGEGCLVKAEAWGGGEQGWEGHGGGGCGAQSRAGDPRRLVEEM